MVKNYVQSSVQPVTPNIHPKQAVQVYVPLASDISPGIASFYNEHFSVINGHVRIKSAYLEKLELYKLTAEGLVLGEQYGIPVEEGNDYYENNAKYYFEQTKENVKITKAYSNISREYSEVARDARNEVYKYIGVFDNAIFSNPYNGKTEQIINSDVLINGGCTFGDKSYFNNDVEVAKQLIVQDLHVKGTSTIENSKSLQIEDNIIVSNYSKTYSRYAGLAMVNKLDEASTNVDCSALMFDASSDVFVIGKGKLNETNYNFDFEFTDYSYLLSSDTNPTSYTDNTLAIWKDGKLSGFGNANSSFVIRKPHKEGVIYVYAETKNGQSSMRAKSSMTFTETYNTIPFRDSRTHSFKIGTMDFNSEDSKDYPLTIGSAKDNLVSFELFRNLESKIYGKLDANGWTTTDTGFTYNYNQEDYVAPVVTVDTSEIGIAGNMSSVGMRTNNGDAGYLFAYGDINASEVKDDGVYIVTWGDGYEQKTIIKADQIQTVSQHYDDEGYEYYKTISLSYPTRSGTLATLEDIENAFANIAMAERGSY